MIEKNVKIVGLAEIQRKLNGSVLLDPHFDHARDTIVDRIVKRPGKGLGARNNTLSPQLYELGARIRSTLNNPRRTGSSWQRKNIGIVSSMAPRVVKKAIAGIEADWAS